MATSVSAVRRWSMLAIALGSTMCANVFINGAAFLIPTLHGERGLDLSRAGLVSAMPSFGMVLTLIAWGWVVDRVGERFVLTAGALRLDPCASVVWTHPVAASRVATWTRSPVSEISSQATVATPRSSIASDSGRASSV